MQLFYSFFKTLVGQVVIVELKNDMKIRGTLHSVDQFLNIKLENISVIDEDKFPHMVCLVDCVAHATCDRIRENDLLLFKWLFFLSLRNSERTQ